MIRIVLFLAALSIAGCAAQTGPPGQPSPGGDVNPVSGTLSKGGK